MDERPVITVYKGSDHVYGISHEIDDILSALAPGLLQGDPEARKDWEPYSEWWPELLTITQDEEEEEDQEDGEDDEDDEDDEEYGFLSSFDEDSAWWPGYNSFWADAEALNIEGVGEMTGGSPASGEIYRIQGDDALEQVIEALADKYTFVCRYVPIPLRPWS